MDVQKLSDVYIITYYTCVNEIFLITVFACGMRTPLTYIIFKRFFCYQLMIFRMVIIIIALCKLLTITLVIF